MLCFLLAVQLVAPVLVCALQCHHRRVHRPWGRPAAPLTRSTAGIVAGMPYVIRAIPLGAWVEFIDPILPSFVRDGMDHLYIEVETPVGRVTMGIHRTKRVGMRRPHSFFGRCDLQVPDCALMRMAKACTEHWCRTQLRAGIEWGQGPGGEAVIMGKALMRGELSEPQVEVIRWFDLHKVSYNQWDSVRLNNSQFDCLAPWSTCPLALNCQLFCQLFHRDPTNLMRRLQGASR